MPPVNTIREIGEDTARILMQHTTGTTSTFFRNTIIGLVAISIVVGGVWFITKKRSQLRESASKEYVILESEVSIEFGDEGLEIEYDDENAEGRHSFETILGGDTPRSMAFEIDKLPSFHINRKSSSILERRGGKKTLILQASEGMDADMALLDIKDGRLTVSPFLSKKDGSRHFVDHPTRRRTPRYPGEDSPEARGPTTAPHQLQDMWRPIDSPIPRR